MSLPAPSTILSASYRSALLGRVVGASERRGTVGGAAMGRPTTVAITAAIGAAVLLVRGEELFSVAWLAAGCVALTERVAPRVAAPFRRPGFATDLAHAVLTTALTGALVAGAVTSLMALHVAGLGAGLVRGQPTWLQSMEGVVCAELGYYAVHRCQHRCSFLWRFHAIHHSSPHLDWLAAARGHPVDFALTRTGALAPILVLGLDVRALAAYAAVAAFQSAVVHANVRIPAGPLRWVVVTPEFHAWHHALGLPAGDRNLASQLPVIDLLFGTAHLPRREPAEFGKEDPVPSTWLSQVMAPLLPRPARPLS